MLDWTEYDRWNEAIAETVFSEDASGVPAYLDLDDDVADALAERLGISAKEVGSGLGETVQSTLRYFGKLDSLFDPHLLRLTRWRQQLRTSKSVPDAPPVLALLAVTVQAAEAMGTGTVAPNAYFPHLCATLGATTADQRKRVEASYRRVAETMWNSVDQWLTRLDGRRGLPSAFALSKRFIGLPMSQALVRAGDRRKLTRMFDSFGLPPGYAMAPGDMAGLFDQWLAQQPCPVSTGLVKLWHKPAARDRIAEVVANELLTWDGSGRRTDTPAGSTGATRGLRLLANLNRGLGRTRLQITLALRAASDQPVTVLATTADGIDIDLSFVPGPGGLLRLDHLQTLNLETVISGVLTVSTPGRVEFSRHPRGLIPLSYDDAQAAYVESERVQLAQDTILLVRDTGARVDDVIRILTDVARPGFTLHDTSTTGVPSGWALFTGVEVMGRVGGRDADRYNELVPLASTQLMLAGGMKLPGRMVKWSSLEPPEIRAISQKASRIKVAIVQRDEADDDSAIAHEFTGTEPALAITLADLRLPDGDYRVSLFEDSGKSPIQQLELRLRSAQTVDAWTWFGAKRLWHDFAADGAWAVMSASEAHVEDVLTWGVDGPCARGIIDVPGRTIVGSHVWWTSARPRTSEDRPPLTVLAPDAKSCVVTGAHYLQLPTVTRGGPRYIEGTCKYCGLVKRQPAWAPRAHRTAPLTMAQAVKVNVQALLPVTEPARETSWAAALDGLMHLGGGRRAWLERLALQVDGTALFVHQFIKTVSALGFIDISRDAAMQFDQWELVPRYLAELGDGSLAMIGYWPRSEMDAAVSYTKTLGGSGGRIESSDAITLTTLTALSMAEAEDVAAKFDATVIRTAATSMLDALPGLSAVGERLPRIPVPGGRAVEQFDLASASWANTPSPAAAGAFRIDSGHGWQFVYRSNDDLATGMAALGDAYLVKHLAAQAAGLPLMAYDPTSRLVVFPVGADLPGLYERAAVLFSGCLPTSAPSVDSSRPRLLAYRDIPESGAQRLWDLMSS